MVAVPGGRVEVEDVPGDPERAPLLFVHGGVGSLGLWRGFHRQVAEATGRRAVAYSRLGHGFSDPLPARPTARFMHAEATTGVPALREALGLDRPVLVGHSDGSSIALMHAARYPVSGVVALAPHVFVEELTLRGVTAAVDDFTDGDLRERLARHHRDPDAAFHAWSDVWQSDAFRGWDVRQELPAITCPILAVQGTADAFGSTAHVEAVCDKAQGPVELLLLDCDHYPHIEQPDEVLAAITQFLA
jgi:pimeloyl-ACP methyl ester carboxylesterase